jgi:two-component system, chemotaxis family, response regulator PixG
MSSLSHQLTHWSQNELTGRLDVQVTNLQHWSLYFRMGRLVWADGGLHPLRRWLRLVKQFYPQPMTLDGNLSAMIMAGSEYNLLIQWVRQHKLVGEQAASWVRSNVTEVLFDILQQEQTQALTFVEDTQEELKGSFALLNPEQSLQAATQIWQVWSKAGLSRLSPNLAPRLLKPEDLENTMPPQVYERLRQGMNGERTLRDLAVTLKQDPLLLCRTLVPHIRRGSIKLVIVPDLSVFQPATIAPQQDNRADSIAPLPPQPQQLSPSQPLIAHIDDSRWECLKMERMVTELGYRYVGVQDSIQALLVVLEHKPNLVFLDLVMPVANGYELCSQIRRAPQFKEIPIIIVTSNDGVLDRLRAKMVGSTDFIGKPIDVQQVQAVLQKYCPA